MNNERFYLTGAGQTGRYNRNYLRKLSQENRLEEVYTKGVLLEIDFASKQILRRLEIDREDMDYPVDGYATNFTVPARSDSTLYVPSHGTVYCVDLPTFQISDKISHPLFNDLHHFALHDEDMYAVSTGIDHVVRLKSLDSDPEIFPALPDTPPLEPGVDYRTRNTKPHASHPNYLFWYKGEKWVTRAKQHDCAKLSDLSISVPLADVMVHDGVEFDGEVHFTSVRGQIISVNMDERRITRSLDIIHKRWHLLTGWCRGLMVTEDFFYVGFSVFRRTKQVENLQWMKSKLMGTNPPLPTRIEKIDRKTGEMVDQLTFEPDELNAVFWFDKV